MDHVVTPAEDGMRLSSLLRSVMKVSYSAMKSAKWDSRILVSGQPRNVDQPVHAGEIVAFIPAADEPVYRPSAFDLTLSVPYEDEFLMVIDKPAPLPSQSSARQSDHTLENAVYSYFGCRIPPQLEKNHVVPPSSQDEALSRYSVSGQVPR